MAAKMCAHVFEHIVVLVGIGKQAPVEGAGGDHHKYKCWR